MRTVNLELLRDAVAFTLTTRRKFSNRRKGNMDTVSTNADKSRLRLSKKLIESPEYDAICSYQGDIYKWLCNRCVPSFFKEGLYLVRLNQVQAFENKLAEAGEKLQSELVPAFVAAYPNQVQAARAALNGQFDIKDYPDADKLADMFGFTWNWIAFGVPENLPEELREAEARKIEQSFKQAEVEIMEALRNGFAEIIAHVTDRLAVPEGEKQKVFRNSLFENLTEFIQTFSARNLVNDGELERLVADAQRILVQVNGENPAEQAETIRDSEGLRERTAQAFANMRAQIEVMTRPSRKFELELE